MKPKILLLSASAGAGHVRAAEALREAFAAHPAAGPVEHWDTLHYTTAAFRCLYSNGYDRLIRYSPRTFGWLYNVTDTPWRRERLRLAFELVNAPRLLGAICRFDPQVIVCTHFTPANLVSHFIRRGQITAAPYVCLTDFDCHAMWLVRACRSYFVALEETRAQMVGLGVAAASIDVTGIPISAGFAPPEGARAAARQLLNLRPDIPVILLYAGGYCAATTRRIAESLLGLPLPLELVAVAGRNAAAAAVLQRLAATRPNRAPVRLQPLGHTADMHRYMHAADLFVGKAGGLTVSECLAAALPMGIVRPIPGQEQRNAAHLVARKAAILCNDLSALGREVQSLLCDGRLPAMATAARAMGRPHAAATIAQSVLATMANGAAHASAPGPAAP